MVIIGCDPGLTGAICVIGPGWQEVIDIPTCPNGLATGSMKRWVDVDALTEILLSLSHRRSLGMEAIPDVFIERPIAMPGQQAATMASNFDTFGVLRAVLGRNALINFVTPHAWKKFYGLKTDKDKSREIASNLYPALAPMLKRVKDHNRAEAVLIAHYGLKEMA